MNEFIWSSPGLGGMSIRFRIIRAAVKYILKRQTTHTVLTYIYLGAKLIYEVWKSLTHSKSLFLSIIFSRKLLTTLKLDNWTCFIAIAIYIWTTNRQIFSPLFRKFLNYFFLQIMAEPVSNRSSFSKIKISSCLYCSKSDFGSLALSFCINNFPSQVISLSLSV